ncbi:MAG: hypothetical protein COB67_06695 [SAR324 cluster bacterium]|uniref:STAS domain-containing protein n=1 Tax=SAR324 cluster bacterium TaxID=2024889 RepID=A0A2A4T428_9DELT|nr:MAG: hypothetical protein COB67_06695 [SAR324 cluster bacterium]
MLPQEENFTLTAPPRSQLLQSEHHQGTMIIKFHGSISEKETVTLWELQEKLPDFYEQGFNRFLLDLSNLEESDHSILGLISKLMHTGKQVLIICQESSITYQTFRALNLLAVLPHFSTLTEALSRAATQNRKSS